MKQEILTLQKQAVQAIDRGRYSEVDRICRKILELDPRFADAWFLLGMAAAGKMDVGQALFAVTKALELAPNNTEYLAQLAKLSALVNKNRQALDAARHALSLKPETALTLDTLGVVLTKLGEFALARDALTRAVSKSPDNAQFHFNLASAEQFLGNHSGAEKHYRAAIKLQPRFARAHWALSELRKNKPDAARVTELKGLLTDAPVENGEELYLSHALSRELEKQGDYAAAFDLLQNAKFRYRAGLNYSWRVDQRMFDAIRQSFPLEKSQTTAPASQGTNAIFVIGMPRSGTTLVERILSTHPQVTSLGELQDFGLAVKRASGSTSRKALDESVTAQTETMDMAQIGQNYLAATASRLPEGGRFIDKMPLNFLYAGYILAALPAARIVCLRRNPMDTCISNYRQLFAISFSYYNYHYDLEDTAHFYRMFHELMDIWTGLYGNRIYQIEYESLVANPEDEARALLAYCDLPWDERVLDFHKNTSAVATASTMQVRQPLYSSSIGRWKHYAEQLAPIAKIFDRHGIEYQSPAVASGEGGSAD